MGEGRAGGKMLPVLEVLDARQRTESDTPTELHVNLYTTCGITRTQSIHLYFCYCSYVSSLLMKSVGG